MEVLQRTANRGSISTGYDIDNSLKLERANSEYLSRTPSSNGNQQIFTFSSWVKFSHINSGVSEWSTLFSAGDYAANSPSFRIGHHTNNSLQVSFYTNSNYTGYYRTDALYRDTSAWYHFVCAVDTTQGTNTNRVKIYVNGVLAPTTSVVSHIAQNYNSGVNTGIAHRIGHGVNMQTYASEYVAETHFVDGQALAPTEFGEFDEDSGIWKPKAYTGSYGTNGFYLDFADASDLGDDESGNGNDFTENNITAIDQATDTPTNNFCTWLPLWTFPIGRTISEGGTNVDGASAWGGCKGTIGVTNGKWYWENKASGNDTIIGWQTDNYIPESNENSMHNIKDTIGFYQDGNNVWIRDETSGRTDATTTGTNASGQIIGMALDLDSSPQTATFYRNGSAISSAINIDGLTGKTIFPFMSQYNQNAESNFGGFCTYTISSAATDENGYGTFEYAPPSGYYALCGKNLAEYGGTS